MLLGNITDDLPLSRAHVTTRDNGVTVVFSSSEHQIATLRVVPNNFLTCGPVSQFQIAISRALFYGAVDATQSS